MRSSRGSHGGGSQPLIEHTAQALVCRFVVTDWRQRLMVTLMDVSLTTVSDGTTV